MSTDESGEKKTTISDTGMDFHIFLEDGDGENILHHERFYLRKREMKLEHVRTFEVKMFEPTPPQYFIHVISDRWMHSKTSVPIVFRNQMVLPSLNPPPTEILDLHPVHITDNSSNSIDSRHRILLSSSHPDWNGKLNALQTQVLPSLYETDQNVLICSPPGSGKLGCSEFAVLRCLGFGNSTNTGANGATVVYVCPRKGRCRVVLERWKAMLGIGLNVTIGCLGFHDENDENKSSTVDEDDVILSKYQVIISTARAWDRATRNWQRSTPLASVKLMIFDRLDLIGIEENECRASQVGDDEEGLSSSSSTTTAAAIAASLDVGGTGSESASYELIVSRMRFMGAQRGSHGIPLRLIGLSSCIANGVDVGHWLGAKSKTGIFSFTPDIHRNTMFPTIVTLKGFDAHHHASRFAAMGKPTWEAVSQSLLKSSSSSTLVFVPSTSQAQTTAIDMVTHAMATPNGANILKGEKSSKGDAMEMDDDESSGQESILQLLNNDETLMELMEHGVAYVHPNQSVQCRRYIVNQLRNGNIRVLVATPSLAWELDIRGGSIRGMTLSIIVRSCEKWNSQERRHVPYPPALLSQMLGHAGTTGGSRPSITVLCHDDQKRRVTSVLTGSTPGAYTVGGSTETSGGAITPPSVIPTVESQVDTSLHDEILSLVATGAVESKQDALDYLTWTFMYRRLPHNPNYYGLAYEIEHSKDGGQKVAEHLSELVEETLTDLHDSGCIEVNDDEDVVTPMNLGMIATFYQAEYTTLEIFASSVRPNLRVREALEVLCAATEFERSTICRIRRGEQMMIREQMKRIPMQITSGYDQSTGTFDVHAKANVLM
jgi:pre-mRNA-splicing helicase BRR2